MRPLRAVTTNPTDFVQLSRLLRHLLEKPKQ
jgi:hypothetical protein